MSAATAPQPKNATGALVLADGSVFWGYGLGATGFRIGEVCFNTSMTGYQEILSDPSYAGQIITFTFPHIGNVGTNDEDIESTAPAALGLILRRNITSPSSWRNTKALDTWLKSHNLIGIAGLDTRHLTRRIRKDGPPTGSICFAPDGNIDVEDLKAKSAASPGLEGMDLAAEVSCRRPYDWTESIWSPGEDGNDRPANKYHVVAIDYGAKHNILRCLTAAGCRVSVVPSDYRAKEILALEPDGIFLSNGPGDPAATGKYAIPIIRELLKAEKSIFGICLGHQLLALALGAETQKMKLGHRGANHPVKDLETGRIEITSQNHGFVVKRNSLPVGVSETHSSLFDGSLEGIRLDDKPIFSVQYHPEASPGPQDSHYLFERFVKMIAAQI